MADPRVPLPAEVGRSIETLCDDPHLWIGRRELGHRLAHLLHGIQMAMFAHLFRTPQLWVLAGSVGIIDEMMTTILRMAPYRYGMELPKDIFGRDAWCIDGLVFTLTVERALGHRNVALVGYTPDVFEPDGVMMIRFRYGQVTPDEWSAAQDGAVEQLRRLVIG